VLYKGVLFYVNLDTLISPAVEGQFVEIKSRTWSRRDAEYKAGLISEMLVDVLGLAPDKRVHKEYLEFLLSV